MATINGDSENNTLIGTSSADVINGFGGNDILNGGIGADELYGGDGDDTLRHYDREASVTNILDGGAGNDFFDIRRDGQLLIEGGSGYDIVSVDFGLNSFGQRTLSGSTFSGIEELRFDGAGFVTFDPGALNTVGAITLGAASDARIAIQHSTGGTTDLTGVTLSDDGIFVGSDGDNDVFDASSATGNWTMDGQRGADTLIGGSGDDNIHGGIIVGSGNQNDVLDGGAGNDILDGGQGSDQLFGGDGNDILRHYYREANVDNVLDGGAGDDFFDIQREGDLEIIGGSGYDLVSINFRNFQDETMNGTTFDGIEELRFDGIEMIIFDPGALNTVGAITLGAASDARIAIQHSTGGTTDLTGVTLSDDGIFVGSDGDNDVFDASSATGNWTMDGQRGADTLIGGSGDDNIHGGIIVGSGNQNDVLDGGAGNDILDGGQGSDQLFGGDGNDILRHYYREANVDNVLDGGAGDDFFDIQREGDLDIIGGSGYDIVSIDFRSWRDETMNGTTFDGIEELRFDGIETIIFDPGALATLGSITLGAASDARMAIQHSTGGTTDLTDVTLNDSGIFYGSSDVDTINISTAAAGWTLSGGRGNDTLIGGRGDDFLIGGSGGDEITGGAGSDTLVYDGFTAVTVSLVTGTGSGGDAEGDIFSGVENIRGSTGGDTLTGNSGDNIITGWSGGDIMDGGAGIDTLSYAGSTFRVTINLSNNFASGGHATGDQHVNFENITGSDFGDTLIGDAIGNVLSGGAGGDKLFSFGGDDTVYGGDGGDRVVSHGGDDVIFGEAGNDWMFGQGGDDTITGGDGNDNFFGGTGTNTMSGDGGNDRFFIDTGGSLDTIDGGDGDDRVVYRNFTTQAVTIDLLDQSLNAGAAAGHTLTNIETIDGTQLDDVISGSDVGRDKVFGWDGDDVINGRDGDDLMWGVNGDDTLNGGAGFDQLRGGSGNDIMDGGEGDDLLDGGADDDTMFGGAGIDKLIGNTGNDTLHGGDGDDRVTGQSGDDILNGDAGNDDVLGGDGNDVMSGDDGDDFMRGNNGDDIIDGGAGADTMYGDGGADTFVFEAGDSLIGAEDYIRRFEATDTIEIAGHTFVATNAFSGSGSFEVRYESTSAGTFIEMDRDGDGAADERIDFDGDRVWTFVSDGTDITGVVSGPEDAALI